MRIFAGIPFLALSPDEATSKVIQYAIKEKQAAFHLVNAYSIAASTENADYREVLFSSNHNLPDGFPIALLTKFSRQPLTQVRGPSLFRDVLQQSQNTEVKHFFLGGSEEVLNLIASKLKSELPGVNVAGVFSPPFRSLTDEEREDQTHRILESDANLVWVALGTPKQDIEAKRIAEATGKTVVAVGAAFDFFAGTVAEAPAWLSKVGLEWLFRFATEPRRLWKRYLVGNLVFLKEVFKD